MKRIFCILTAVLLIMSVCVSAASESMDFSACTDYELNVLLTKLQLEAAERIGKRLSSPESDFVYASNGYEVRINDYTGTDAHVVIPEDINGTPVTRIYNSAFLGAQLESVSLPDTITEIGDLAFAWARTEGKSVGDGTVLYLPSNLRTVGTQAFAGNGYAGVVVNSDVKIDTDAFQNMNNLKFIYVREGAAPEFDHWSVRSCTKLETVIIPPSVKHINDTAFEVAKKLKIITAPGSAAEAWAIKNFFPVDTQHYAEYAAEYEALFPLL